MINLFYSSQLQEAQETTNQVRVSTEKLSNKTKKTRDKIEQELKNAEDIKKQFIDFLSGEDCITRQALFILLLTVDLVQDC